MTEAIEKIFYKNVDRKPKDRIAGSRGFFVGYNREVSGINCDLSA